MSLPSKAAPFRNLHVPLPVPLYERLRAHARLAGIPATRAARDAIVRWLRELDRGLVHDQVAAYAATAAGSSDDLDPALEAAGLEAIRPRRRRRR